MQRHADHLRGVGFQPDAEAAHRNAALARFPMMADLRENEIRHRDAERIVAGEEIMRICQRMQPFAEP